MVHSLCMCIYCRCKKHAPISLLGLYVSWIDAIATSRLTREITLFVARAIRPFVVPIGCFFCYNVRTRPLHDCMRHCRASVTMYTSVQRASVSIRCHTSNKPVRNVDVRTACFNKRMWSDSQDSPLRETSVHGLVIFTQCACVDSDNSSLVATSVTVLCLPRNMTCVCHEICDAHFSLVARHTQLQQTQPDCAPWSHIRAFQVLSCPLRYRV